MADAGGGGRDGTRERGGDDRDDHDGSESVSDPVKHRFAGETDLYDIAAWESRTGLDGFAVFVANGLRAVRGSLLVTLAFALFVGQMVVAGALVLSQPILGILAIVSVLPALFLAMYLWYQDPTRREPVRLLGSTFLLAVLFASFAALVNSSLLPIFELIPVVGLPLFYFLVVGPIEETVKWLAVRVHAYRSPAFQTVVDGVVYGAIAGLGFAAIENLFYIVFFSVSETPGGLIVENQYAVAIAATRLFVGPGHVVFSAWAGFYLGLAKFNPDHRGPIVVKGLLVATFIHASYNTLMTLIPLSLLGFVAFVVVYHGFWFGLLYRKVATYRTLYRTVTEEAARSRADRTGPEQ
jgi:RsiW-degrading membrane proteinase PrsW (M82 family)